MIHVAICDDERDFVTDFRKLIEQYSIEQCVEIKTTVYYDGHELIENYDPTIDLIFLDIQMKIVNGLQAAGRIRQMDAKVEIIFLTTLTQYGLEGYQYQATNYIIKPLKYGRLKFEMDNFLERHRVADNPIIVVANDSGKYKVFLKTLRYVETFGRNLLFHTEQEKIVCYKSMKEVQQELQGKGFARCHTSYIVNMFYVKNVNRLEIGLITGEIIPISQPKRKGFMEQLTEYWGKTL